MMVKSGGGASETATWADVGGASDYVLFSDPLPSGGFTTQEGTASTGVTGVTIPMQAGNLVCYKVAGRNPTCGLGPK